MLTACGFGVSMGNAMDAPRLAADYATATNNEGGVGQFLDRVFRVRSPARFAVPLPLRRADLVAYPSAYSP